MTDDQIKVLEAMRSFYEVVLPSLSEHSKVRNEYQNDYDALTAALEYIRDMRELEAAAEHLREAFKAVKGGKD